MTMEERIAEMKKKLKEKNVNSKIEEVKELKVKAEEPETKAEEPETKAEEPETKTKKKTIKKEKDTPKESEQKETATGRELTRQNINTLPSNGFEIKLPTAQDLLKSGQLVGVGRADIINSLLASFLPIIKVRAAHPNNEPEFLGKAVYGKLGEQKEWDYETPLIPISFHAWLKYNDMNGREEKYLTVFFINPADRDRIICVSGKNYSLDRLRKVALGGIRKIWTIAGVDLVDTKWTEKGKEKTGKTPVLRFEDITSMAEDFEIDPADVEYGLNIVAQHLTKFYQEFPEQHPDNSFINEFNNDEDDEIPF